MMTLQKESHQPVRGVVAENNKAKSSSNFNATVNVIARLRLRGHHVTRTSVGGFNVSFQGLTRHFSDIETLREFAKKAGAKS